MPDEKRRNTDPYAFGRGLPPLTSEEDMRAAHQMLFGRGAKVSWYARPFATPEEKAMELRPRAADYGKDISLPAETRAAVIKKLGERPPGVAPARMQSPAGAERMPTKPPPRADLARTTDELRATKNYPTDILDSHERLFGKGAAVTSDPNGPEDQRGMYFINRGEGKSADEQAMWSRPRASLGYRRDKSLPLESPEARDGDIGKLAQMVRDNPDLLPNLTPQMRIAVLTEMHKRGIR